MATSLETLNRAQSVQLWQRNWIISGRADLIFFIGSVVSSYLLLMLNVSFGVPMLYIFWIWSLGFDGPHIFGTVSRTYLDREERRERGKLLLGSLIFFFSFGPVLMLLHLKPLFLLIFATWAYYHVLRQHYGFMILYKKKNEDLSPRDNSIDRLFLAVMMIYPPFQRFFIYRVEEMGIPSQWALSRTAPWLDPILKLCLLVIAMKFLLRQWQKYRAGESLNLPKYLLMLAVIPLHWLTFHYLGPKDAVPVVTIFHNIQYHGIIWYYNRNRYRDNHESRVRFGALPIWLTERFIYYAIAGLIFSACYRIPGYWLGHNYDLALGLFAGFGLTHYYLDSRIWRVRHDRELNKTLKLAAS